MLRNTALRTFQIHPLNRCKGKWKKNLYGLPYSVESDIYSAIAHGLACVNVKRSITKDIGFATENVINSIKRNHKLLIQSLGEPTKDNEYILKPDSDGVWWLTHKHVGSGEPLEQFLNAKPIV